MKKGAETTEQMRHMGAQRTAQTPETVNAKQPAEQTAEPFDGQRGAVLTECFDTSFGAVLRASHPDGEKRELLASLGLPPTILSAVALAIALKAAGGDVSAAKFLRDTCCEDSEHPRDTDLTPYTDEELRSLLKALQGENPRTGGTA